MGLVDVLKEPLRLEDPPAALRELTRERQRLAGLNRQVNRNAEDLNE
jgi:hypothetical protein